MNKKARSIKSDMISNAIKSVDPITARKVDNLMYISAKIKDLMDRQGLRKSDLAKKLSKEPSVITKWLSGTHNFTISTISEIEIALGAKIIDQPSQTVIELTHIEFTLEQNQVPIGEASTYEFGGFTSQYFAEA